MSSSCRLNSTGQKEPTSSLWADKAAAPANIVAPPNVTKKPVVKGSRSINHGSKSIKAVPWSDRVTFVIRRLDKATTETDLIEYLEELGVSDVNCKKLVAKDGRQFKTSAFPGKLSVILQRYMLRRRYMACKRWPERLGFLWFSQLTMATNSSLINSFIIASSNLHDFNSGLSMLVE